MDKIFVLVVAFAAADLAAAQQVRPLEQRSAFEGYRRYVEVEVSGWREKNDEVGRVGGHVGMQRHGAASKPAPKELLAKPLSAEDAMQLALRNNPGVQAKYALETRKAWFGVVAARENAKYMEQVKDAAEASAELAQRMAAAGNFSKLDQAREHAFYAEAAAQLARARHAELAARERLAQLTGLSGEELALRLPERLPELPQEARQGVDLARSGVREAYGTYRGAFDLARHYRDEVVPLRKRISEEMLLRYNGMLASVFELLADSREQVAAANAHIEALREFWMAEAELQMALSGGKP